MIEARVASHTSDRFFEGERFTRVRNRQMLQVLEALARRQVATFCVSLPRLFANENFGVVRHSCCE